MIDKTVHEKTNFPLITEEELIIICDFDEKIKEIIHKLIDLMKICKAGSKHHGTYEGGLFDHTMLVCSLAKNIHTSLNSDIDIKMLMRAAFFHDLGKIISHPNNKVKEIESLFIDGVKYDIDNLSVLLEDEFGYSISSHQKKSPYEHSLKSLYILTNLGFREKKDVLIAIMLHHGGWSDFKRENRVDNTSMSAILHSADLIASKVLNI